MLPLKSFQPGTMDANLKDLFLVGRLIGDAADGAVVVGVSGPLTITIRPNFTVKLSGVGGASCKLASVVLSQKPLES